MHPTLHLGALKIPTYDVVYAVALVIVGVIAYARALRLGDRLDPTTAGRRLLGIIVCGFVGTHLIGFVPSAIDSLRIGRWIWTGQANFAGTLTFGVLGGAILYRRDLGLYRRALDLGGIPFALLQSLGRVGCWAAGCCYGIPTDSPLAMYLRNAYGEWAWRYPAQLMSGVANLLIFAALLIIERIGIRKIGDEHTWPFDGFLFGLYLLLFCVERFTMEFIRGDSVPLLGPLSWVHLYTLAAFIVVSLWMLSQSRRPS